MRPRPPEKSPAKDTAPVTFLATIASTCVRLTLTSGRKEEAFNTTRERDEKRMDVPKAPYRTACLYGRVSPL